MRNVSWKLIAAFTATAAASLVTFPMAGQQAPASKAAAAPAPKRDLSGVWQFQSGGGAQGLAPEKDMPPMTAWAQAKFATEKPGYGSRATTEGNDPILHCDPMGFPRVIFLPTPFEFVAAPGRTLQFFEREHQWRPIWTDGRSLPKDPDPTWYGNAIGHWESDDTFVVESSGFNDKSWLGATGYPHSEDMRTVERYHRVDHDTIAYDITVYDPTAYTKPIVAPQKTMKLLAASDEIEELICVASDEETFAKKIRVPAVAQPKK
jgi:hypothetical protein